MNVINLNDGEIEVNGKKISFNFDVVEYIELESVIVIRLKIPTNVIFNENVFGLNKDGKIIWQIEQKKFMYENSPYTNMKKINNYKVNLSNWDGTQILINPINGNILDEKWVK